MNITFGTVLWNALIKVQKIVMIITGIATILLVFVPLILRETGIPFPAYEEFLLIFAFWMYMMGSSYGSYERSQISADILSQFLKGKPKTVLLIIKQVGTFILGAIFTYWGFVLVQWTHSTGALTSVYKIPIIFGQISIFISLLLSSIYNFVYMVEEIRNIINFHASGIQKTIR